jgi:hypothetical protein
MGLAKPRAVWLVMRPVVRARHSIDEKTHFDFAHEDQHNRRPSFSEVAGYGFASNPPCGSEIPRLPHPPTRRVEARG